MRNSRHYSGNGRAPANRVEYAVVRGFELFRNPGNDTPSLIGFGCPVDCKQQMPFCIDLLDDSGNDKQVDKNVIPAWRGRVVHW